MKRKTLYVDQYVECEYDIQFQDIIDVIQDCNDEEIEEIKKITNGEDLFKNLYDKQKFDLLKVAMKKYNLDELQQRLDIKNEEF